MHRNLTQAGMNRVIWHMLKALGGTFKISHKDLEAVNPDIAIRVDHTESTDIFTLSLQHLNVMAQDNSKIIESHIIN